MPDRKTRVMARKRGELSQRQNRALELARQEECRTDAKYDPDSQGNAAQARCRFAVVVAFVRYVDGTQDSRDPTRRKDEDSSHEAGQDEACGHRNE